MTLLAEGKIRALKASSNFAVAILMFSLPLGGCTSVGNTLGGLSAAMRLQRSLRAQQRHRVLFLGEIRRLDPSFQ